MNRKEYEKLRNFNVIDIEQLQDKTDRTLLWGYTCDRDSWHVYIKNGEIYTVFYSYKQEPIEINVQYNSEYVPDKRLYPEACDYDFCRLLSIKGVNLPFTTWSDGREPRKYYGETL